MVQWKKSGKTIAVLGSGFNNIYPEENEWLFHKILVNGGCIISEYEPNVEKDMSNFPKRNRIISGISNGVLVVEAGHRSGSTITAKFAKEEEKNVYAIPSNITSSTGIGTNKLIREGAILITKPSQIIRDFNQQKSSEKVNSKKISIPKEYRSIYHLLEQNPMYINEISKKEKKSISELNGILTIMEIEGYITRLDQNQYSVKER